VSSRLPAFHGRKEFRFFLKFFGKMPFSGPKRPPELPDAIEQFIAAAPSDHAPDFRVFHHFAPPLEGLGAS